MATQVREATLAASPTAHRSNGRFWRHFGEMFVAMLAGMAVFGGLVSGVLALLGHSSLLHFVVLRAFLMAGYMTAGMAVWMRYRGHDWTRVWEMGIAMFAPFLILLVPYLAGAIEKGGLLGGGHMLMIPAMLGVMLYRRDEYSRDHSTHAGHKSTAAAEHVHPVT